MRPKKSLLIILLLLAVIIFSQSVGFAASFFDSLALGLEKDLGRSNYQSITSEKTVVELPPAQANNLNDMFKRLVSKCSRRKELDFKLTVIKDDSVNAFALPGGYVFVNTGLLSYVKSDGELAGVIGHEIAHIDRKHSMDAIYRAVGLSFIIGLLLNNESDEKRREQMATLASISLSLVQLGYSRGAEFEADEYGVKFMQKAGYNKQDILNFWQRFLKQNGDNPSALALFSTHPPTKDRIKRIEALP